MERLAYPMAGDMVKSLEKEQETQAQMEQAQAQMGGMMPPTAPAAGGMGAAPALGGGLV